MPRMPRSSKTSNGRNRNAELGVIKRQRTARLTKVAAKAAMLQRRGREDEAYTLICDEFMALGGIYVKFLQGVLLNTPVMRRWHNPKKLNIFENLEYESVDIIALLRSELGEAQLAQIAKLQTTPFAAGSFGQVYYGELQSGQPIIVKTLRPQTRELLQHDLRLLSLFTRFFANRHLAKEIDVKFDDAIKDFRRATLTETDYVKEAHFASEIYDQEENNPNLVIPKTYLELCTPYIIVQDFINGISCAEVLEQKAQNDIEPSTYVREKLGSDLTAQLETLGLALLDGCFSSPRIMGDPHPGNVRLLPDNKIGLIDFGIAAAAPANRAAFYGLIKEWAHMYNGTLNVTNLFEQFLRMFVNDLHRALKKLMAYQQSDKGSMLKGVSAIAKEIFDDESQATNIDEMMSKGRMMRLFNQIINKGNRLGLVIRVEDSAVLRAAQTYMSLVESMGLRSEVIGTVFTKATEQASREHPELDLNNDKPLNTSQALEIVTNWLERVASHDPQLFSRFLELFAPQTAKPHTTTMESTK